MNHKMKMDYDGDYDNSSMQSGMSKKEYGRYESMGENFDVRGDMRAIPETGASYSGDYEKSLGDAKRSDVMTGFYGKSKITKYTGIDDGFA